MSIREENRIPLTPTLRLAAVGLAASVAAAAAAADWPQWGRDGTKNMVGHETGLPTDFHPGDFIGATDEIDETTTRNIRWIAKLGSQSYGNPTVANGRIYVGTNNDSPRDPRFSGDRCVIYCLDEKSGQLHWQLNLPKMGTGKVSDWEFLGMCSSPSVEGDRVYLVTNHCEVVCLDANGMADGNDGPFTDEGALMADKGKPPVEPSSTDADVIWRMNMIDECGVFPHNITSSAVLVAGDRVWVSTSNGVDYGHVETPAPFAPSLIMLDKRTGKLLGEEASGLSQRILHCNWSSPAYLNHGGTELCIFGGPDGWCYAFRPDPVKDEEGYDILDEAWRFDCNLPEYRMKDGKPVKYATRAGPSEVLATPVVHEDRVYVAIGQDPEHGEGLGNLVCIDATKTGDITRTGKVWNYSKIKRSMSTLAVTDGLVFTADYSGFVYCLDAETGAEHWMYDTKGHIWGSPLVSDGKLFIGNEDGYLTILAAGPEEKLIAEIDMMSPIYSSPIVANGVLYVATHTHLFAIASDAE
jgi:outer membrane protein assembly factor BamB